MSKIINKLAKKTAFLQAYLASTGIGLNPNDDQSKIFNPNDNEWTNNLIKDGKPVKLTLEGVPDNRVSNEDTNYNSESVLPHQEKIVNLTSEGVPNNRVSIVNESYNLKDLVNTDANTETESPLKLTKEEVLQIRSSQDYIDAKNGLDESRIAPFGENFSPYYGKDSVYEARDNLKKEVNFALDNIVVPNEGMEKTLLAINLAIHDHEVAENEMHENLKKFFKENPTNSLLGNFSDTTYHTMQFYKKL